MFIWILPVRLRTAFQAICPLERTAAWSIDVAGCLERAYWSSAPITLQNILLAIFRRWFTSATHGTLYRSNSNKRVCHCEKRNTFCLVLTTLLSPWELLNPFTVHLTISLSLSFSFSLQVLTSEPLRELITLTVQGEWGGKGGAESGNSQVLLCRLVLGTAALVPLDCLVRELVEPLQVLKKMIAA